MLFQVTIFPTDNKSESASEAVSQVIDLIDKSGIPYKTSAMSTDIEGDWQPVMALINECRLKLRKTHSRLYIVISVDDREGAQNRLTGKIESIEKHLGRKVQK
jgi:uncharacterized protein (TIGR00106 family)